MLEDLQVPKRIRPCKTREVKETLDAKDSEILENLIMSFDWPVKTLEKSLAEKGIMLGEGVIRKHRHKLCGCYDR